MSDNVMLVDTIVLYYDNSNIFDDFVGVVKFEDKVDYDEVHKYIMELKQTLDGWNLCTIVDELEKKYKIKSYDELQGKYFIDL